MTSPARGSEKGTRSGLRRGVRGQALDVVLHCYADSVGADRAILLGEARRPIPGFSPPGHAKAAGPR